MAQRKPRKANLEGHRRKFMVIVDESPECESAVYFSACRARNTGSDLQMLFVVESEQAVRGVAVLYTCKRDIDAARESLLLLNPGFREMPQDKRFDVLFTFGGNQQRGYADATLTADSDHGTLDLTAGLPRILRHMQQFNTFIVTQKDAAETPITEVAIPLDGFDEAYAFSRERCEPSLP